MGSVASALSWLHSWDCRRAQSVVPVPGGTGLLHDAFPAAHDHNKLSIVSACEAAELVEAAERVLGGAGRPHRLIEVRSPEVAFGVTPGLLAAGYAREDSLVLQWPGPAPVVPRSAELPLADRVAAATRGWSMDLPQAPPDVWRQLGHRIETAVAAGDCTFLGICDDQGSVVARADLYVWDGIAQVEEVMTDVACRGRGYATFLVREAVARALAAGAQDVLIVADADGWPKDLYRRLGFQDLVTVSSFSR